MPARSRVSYRLTASGGDCDLYAFDRSARSFSSKPVARSRRGRGKADTFVLRNSGRSARTAYVVIDGPALSDSDLGSRYALTLKRLRYR